MNTTIFKHYANALHEIAVEANSVKKYLENLHFINKAFEANPEFVKFLDTPFIEDDVKKKAIDNVFKESTEPYVLIFLKILIENDLIKYFSEIATEFSHKANSYLGILEGIIYSPFELSDEQIRSVSSVFETKFQKSVDLKVLIDRSLIGGLKIIINDRVYDYSLLNKINSIENSMLIK